MGGKGSGWHGPRDKAAGRTAGNQHVKGTKLWKPPASEEQRAKWRAIHDKRRAARPPRPLRRRPGPPRPGDPDFIGPPKPPGYDKRHFHPGTPGNLTPGYQPQPRATIPEHDPRFRPHPLRGAFGGYLDDTPVPDHLKIPIPMPPDLQAQYVKALVESTPFDALFADLSRYANDPLGFVMWAFPWGVKGTVLEHRKGPEKWQREQLDRIGKKLRAGASKGCVIEEDVASGHGVGKSAEVSWLILWAISTFDGTRGVVTANTDTQLRTKTWAELAKWYGLFIAKQLFTLTATALYIAGDDDMAKEWRIDQIPWSKEKSEAFAGMHNQGKRILVLFDEASAIDDIIFEVTEGALTDADTQIVWCRFGNPTKTSGRFFKNMTQPRRSTPTRVDSREVSFSNKEQIQAWIDEYGEDSDFVRVRVKGMFPRAGYANFISPELVMAARRSRRRLDPLVYRSHPKILAIDPARFGDDFSVITLRQGLQVHWQVALSGFDGPDLASRVFEICRHGGRMGNDQNIPVGDIAVIVYDAIGNGADLDSALRRMTGLPPLIAVQWGQPAKDAKQYFNQRSECWGTMRDWLAHGSIPDDDGLADELTCLDYGYDGTFRIQLQSKKDAKKAGIKSPDKADSLALSFIPQLIETRTTMAKVRPTVRRKVVWSR